MIGNFSIRRARLAAPLLAAVLVLCASPAHAVWFWGTKPLGMGTAFTAVADDNNAIQVNPAGIAQASWYAIAFNYERREHEIGDYPQLHEDELTPDEDVADFGSEFFVDEDNTIDAREKNISDFFHGSVVDGKTTSNFAAGISFTAANFPSRTFNEGKDYRAALALAGNFADTVFIGGAAKYNQLEAGEGNINADFGFLVRAFDLVGFGLAGRNVFGSQDPYRIEREVAVGVAGFVLDYATVAFDLTKIFDVDEEQTFNFATGVEGFVFRQASTRSGLALRGGFTWDQIFDRDHYSLGFAWIAPEGTLGYSFRGDIENSRNFQHSIEISIRF
ncbi:hypothetical protein K8I61_19855 [bacterium]|nr:hypothetical protein [bacterium]